MADEKVAKLSFDSSEADRQLADLENRLEQLARKAERISLGSPGGAVGGVGSSGGVSGGNAALGGASDALMSKLDTLVAVLQRQADSGGGGGVGAPGGGGKSLWTNEAISAFARENRPQDTERRGFSQSGAIIGAIGGMAAGMTGGNPVAGALSSAGAIAGAFSPIAGMLVGALGSLFSAITEGANKYVQHAQNQLTSRLAERRAFGGRMTDERLDSELTQFSKWGVGSDEAIKMRIAFQKASGAYAPQGAELARLQAGGLDAGEYGAFASNRYGGPGQGAEVYARRFMGLAEGMNLAPGEIVGKIAQARSSITEAGGQFGVPESEDMLARAYATRAGRESGLGATKAYTGMAQAGVSVRQQMLAPLSSLGEVLDLGAAYQAAGASGKGGFEGLTAGADFAGSETPEEKMLRYRALGISDETIAGMIAARTGTSTGAGRALAAVAGRDAARAETTPYGMSEADRASKTNVFAEIQAFQTAIEFGRGLGESEVFQQLLSATRQMNEAAMAMGPVLSKVYNFIGLTGH